MITHRPLRCRLITPTARVLDADVSYADIPLHDGQIGVQATTAPIAAKLGPGALRLDIDDKTTRVFAIDGGFMQHVDGAVTILATGAAEDVELDPAAERAALAEAKARTSSDFQEMARITAERDRARVRASLAENRA